MLRLRGVGKRYGSGPPVLCDIDLDIDNGDVVGILGANGSGKSTLMRVIAGVSAGQTGTVTGRPRTGYLPDRFPAGLRMTAIDYLRHMGRMRGLSSRVATERGTRLLDRLAIEPDQDASLRTLSKGNAQKVGLAQALLPDPELLVLDEPWSGLDQAAQGVLHEIIAELRASGASVVFTDHRESIVRANATRSHRLADGRLHDVPELSEVMARVVLERRASRGDLPWAALTGVHVDTEDNGRVVLRVPATCRDELLLRALQDGWSVHEVAPR